jgi:hypothetical protein
MCLKRIYSLPLILAMVALSMLASTASGQEMMRSGGYDEGYGVYGMMGQDPDEILAYGRSMMRYGFRETSMSGGANKYPGYDRHLSDATVKKLNAEQESFIQSTEALRQRIYEKELYLKAELVKKQPDVVTALGFQKEISEARGQFEQKMIKHLIQMKIINLEAKK